MARFVLLRHQSSPGSEKPSHWDFMLERAGVLWTWQLPELPQQWHNALGDVVPDTAGLLSEAVPAGRLADHRLAYLDYEGPLSRNRGSVSRCDTGTYTLAHETKNRLEIDLAGNLLQGRIVLEPDTTHEDQWLLKVVGWNER